MKKFINLCLFSVSAAVLTAVPAAAAKKNAVAVPKEQAAKPAQKTVPKPPVIPEKKQPFELWMTARNKAFECIDKKQYDEALKFFDQAEKEADRGVWKNYTLYDKVRLLTTIKRSGEALELLSQKVSRDRNTPYHRARVALMRGEIFIVQEKYDEAVKELTPLLASEVKNWIPADAALALGKICEARKDDAGARKYYRSVLNDREFLPGIRSKGLIAEVKMFEKRKEYAQGLAYLDARKNIEQLPPDRVIDIAFLRSELQIAMKDLKSARATLDEAMGIPGKPSPWYAALLTRMAKISYQRKYFQDAQNLMRRARSVRGAAWGYDREFHKEVDRTIARINRERIQRERKARIQKERRARIERQRKAQLERERRAKLERERKAKQKPEKK